MVYLPQKKISQLSNRVCSTIIKLASLWSSIKYIGGRQHRNSSSRLRYHSHAFNLSFSESSKLLEKNNTVWHIYGFPIHQKTQDCLVCFPTLHKDHFKPLECFLNPDPSLSSGISVGNTLLVLLTIRIIRKLV